MNLFAVLLAVSVTSTDGLQTSYSHKLRSDIATADRVILTSSPELGDLKCTIDGPNSLVRIARKVSQEWPCRELGGKLGMATYISLRAYRKNNSDPVLQLTVTPDLAIFEVQSKLYVLKQEDHSLFKHLFQRLHGKADSE